MRKLGVLAVWLLSNAARAATLMVGPGQPYALPCDAINAASAGDTILVDAAGNGSYDGDHCNWTTDNLTVSGTNGRASINAGGTPSLTAPESNIDSDKGIFVIYANNATIENFELSGAVADPGSLNGAGIRHQGTNLTVRNCYFHDNEDGILGAPATADTGTVLIEFSEFAHNGAGDGESHNMYLNHYALFTLQYSYSHSSVIGHLVKSRAQETHIQYNLLADETDGTGSYEIDVPQGGLTYVIGNSIEQSDAGAYHGNPIIIAYSEESATAGPNPIQQLFLANNTIVNDSDEGTFLNAVGSPQVTLTNNIYHGAGATPAGGTFDWTDAQGDPLLADTATFDYALQGGSPCVDAGADPGSGAGQPLEPVAQYLRDAGPETRDNGHWDIGAFEFDDQGTPVPDDGGLTTTGGGSSGGAASGGGASTGGPGGGSSGGGSIGGSTSGTSAGTGGGSTSGGSRGSSGATSNSGGNSAGGGVSGGGSSPDAGTAPATASGGCGCASKPGGGAGGLVWTLLFGLGLWRRRR